MIRAALAEAGVGAARVSLVPFPLHHPERWRFYCPVGTTQYVLADEVQEFHERAAMQGGLGRVSGADLMPILLNLTDRVRLHGVRHQRQARPYWQWRAEPFIIAPECRDKQGR